jgi:hypothetical protein
MGDCVSSRACLDPSEKKKNLLSLPGIEQHFFGCPAHGIVTIDTRLTPLTIVYQVINICHFMLRALLSLWIFYLSYWNFTKMACVPFIMQRLYLLKQ